MSRPDLTRRQNIEENLLLDGAYYCYEHTFDGRLHNGHADYLRGAMAVGCLLGIPEYIRWAVEGPFSIQAMIDNNLDRDGGYYETSTMYAHHTRSLYLTFAEPLLNWRDDEHPDGIDLFAQERFRRFYLLPDLVLDCAGHTPNFGDMAPDNRFALPARPAFSAIDYQLAEHLYAGCRRPADKALFAAALAHLAQGKLDRLRAESGLAPWLLFHADDLPAKPPKLPAETAEQLDGSWFMGQKGLVVLRGAQGQQAALMRFGPSLNHADEDELGLLYYGGGWQLTYDIGYGLGSTHTHAGWANRTAAHNLVVVDEQNQLQGDGSGGGLTLFARLPGLQVAEAEDHNAYSKQQVTTYRRTLALVDGPTPGSGYLVDLFRVRGGRQHDYFLGAQGQSYQVAGRSLGAARPGSLAGPDIAWGTKVGNDGDIVGYPNKPYWNPPPGNGYGFFYDVQPAAGEGPLQVTWSLGGPADSRFRAWLLPPTDSELLTAKAPGLYPKRGYGASGGGQASYAVVRRQAAAPLASGFVTVMQPSSRPVTPGLIPAADLEHLVCDATAEVKPIPSLGIVLLKAERAGQQIGFTLQAPQAGEHAVVVSLLRAPSYGVVQFSLDGRPLGEPIDLRADDVTGPELFPLGRRLLAAGRHTLSAAMLMPPGEPRYYLGIAGIALQTPAQAAADRATPFLAAATRLACTSEAQPGRLEPLGVKVVHADGRIDYLLSGDIAGPRSTWQDGDRRLELGGALAFVRLSAKGEVERANLCGADWLQVGDWRLEAPARALSARVQAVDVEAGTVDLALPAAATRGLAGQAVHFTHPRYSRPTTYRVQGAETIKGGVRLQLGRGALLLGQGQVSAVEDDGTLLCATPHEYACPYGPSDNSRFFDGKAVENGRGGRTRLRRLVFGAPMRLEVEDSRAFAAGDRVVYTDVQPGDRCLAPLPTAWPAVGR